MPGCDRDLPRRERGPPEHQRACEGSRRLPLARAQWWPGGDHQRGRQMLRTVRARERTRLHEVHAAGSRLELRMTALRHRAEPPPGRQWGLRVSCVFRRRRAYKRCGTEVQTASAHTTREAPHAPCISGNCLRSRSKLGGARDARPDGARTTRWPPTPRQTKASIGE